MLKTETARTSKLALAFAALALTAAALFGVAANPSQAEAVSLPYSGTTSMQNGAEWYYAYGYEPGQSGWYAQEGWKDYYGGRTYFVGGDTNNGRYGEFRCYNITVSQASKVSIALTGVESMYDTYEGCQAVPYLPQVYVVKKATTGGVYWNGAWASNGSWTATSDITKTVSLKKGSYAVFVYGGVYVANDGSYQNAFYNYQMSMKDVTPKATSVTLNASSKTLTVGGTYSLLKSKSPSISKGITWTSSNKNIATVDSTGKVTAKNLGKCTIKAKCANGSTKSCTIIVNKKTVSYILKGSSKSLKSYAQYASGYSTGKWSSSNKGIATVTSKGTIKGIKAGTCKVYLKTSARTYTFNVTVKNRFSTKVTKIAKDGSQNKVYFYVYNNTGKAVKQVKLRTYEYNSSGTLIEKAEGIYSESTIPAKGSEYIWGTVKSTAKTCKVSVVKVWYTDGTTWTNS